MDLQTLQNLPTLNEIAGLDDARLLLAKQRADEAVRKTMNRGFIGPGGRFYTPGYGESIETAMGNFTGRQMQDTIAEIQSQLQRNLKLRESDAIQQAFPDMPPGLPPDLRSDVIAAMQQAEEQQFRTAERTASQDYNISRDKSRSEADIALRRTPSAGSPGSSGFAPGRPPAGYRWSADGTALEPIPGGPASARQEQAVTKAATPHLALLGKIDNALAELDKAPDAIGLRTFVPDVALQRLDPEGVAARAAVGELGAEKAHELYGAAFTGAERRRADQFIPASGDSLATVKTKLLNMRKLAEQAAQRAGSSATPATQASGAGEIQTGRNGIRYRFKGGDRTNKANWEPIHE